MDFYQTAGIVVSTVGVGISYFQLRHSMMGATFASAQMQAESLDHAVNPSPGQTDGEGGRIPVASALAGAINYELDVGHVASASRGIPKRSVSSPSAPHTVSSVQGWTFAAFIPYGLFAFMNGSPAWGIVGLLSALMCFIPYTGPIALILLIAYWINIGRNGKKLAWHRRRWIDARSFNTVMRRWDGWGIAYMVVVLFALLGRLATLIAGK